jgi:DNA-binding transcriptional regulator YhcF (GntR family)
MLLTIDLDSPQPIYVQIRNAVVEGIAGGKLKDGDTLPPVRALAAQLGVNLHTVNKAYRMLQLDGFVKILGSRGTVVTAAGGRDSRDFMEAAAETLKNIVSEAVSRKIPREQLIGLVNRLYNETGGNA